jgi:hypothetical protein
LAATGIVSVYAGPLGINPGNVLNPDGTVSIGLLPSDPATGNNGAGTTGGPVGGVCNPTINPDCITADKFIQRNLVSNVNMLHSGAVSPNLPQDTGVTCTVNCQQTIYAPPNKPEFEMLGDGTTGNNSNIWYSVSTGTGAGSATINIPVGIFGVSSVSTMLNTVAGLTTGGTVCTDNGGLNPQTNCSNTASYAYITLNFNSALDGSGASASESFALINGVTQRNLFAGLSDGGASTLAAGGSYNVVDPFNSQSYAVNVGNEWNGTVSGSLTSALNDNLMYLDYQMFPVFSEYQNLYLTSITITDTGTTASSHEILSAATVTYATPEPATAMMFISGLALVGLMWRRRMA